jgi:hypothetical protein
MVTAGDGLKVRGMRQECLNKVYGRIKVEGKEHELKITLADGLG